jgi:hypothetical protein
MSATSQPDDSLERFDLLNRPPDGVLRGVATTVVAQLYAVEMDDRSFDYRLLGARRALATTARDGLVG